MKAPFTDAEEAVLRTHYPQGGSAACRPLLPGRSMLAIYTRAYRLGLRVDRRALAQATSMAIATPDMDEAIRRHYHAARSGKAEPLAELAQRFAVPERWMRRRAQELGVLRPRSSKAWSPAERELLARHAHRTLRAIEGRMTRAGFCRSQTAIARQIEILGVERSHPDAMTANDVARAMGVEESTANRWLAQGWLRAERRNDGVVPRGPWAISRDALREFLLAHSHRVELARVPNTRWLLELVATPSPRQIEAIRADGEARSAQAIRRLTGERDDLDRQLREAEQRLKERRAAPAVVAIGARLGVQPAQAELLARLAKNDHAGVGTKGRDKIVQVHVVGLRRALPEAGLIETRHGDGYALRADWREAMPWLAEIVSRRPTEERV